MNDFELKPKERQDRRKEKTMKTEEHTSGPWMVRYQLEFGGKLTIVAGNNQAPKTLATVEHIGARTEQETNARLIAAAPEMLEALKFIADKLNDPALVTIADAAIAKAKGETP